MIRPSLSTATAILALALFVLVTPRAADAQDPDDCNHCGTVSECDPFHWDNCGFAGPGYDWEGECTSGCDDQDCSNHTTECEVTLAWLTLDEAVDLVAAGDWMGLAEATITGRAEFDSARQMLYLRSCDGEHLVAQLPLPDAEQFVSIVKARQRALLATLPQ